MKRLHLLLTALALGTGSTFAQSTGDARLQGRLLRASDRQAIDMGNALLRRLPDSTLVTGVVTDSLGTFSLTASAGTYLLELRALGYQGQYKTITLPATGLDLGELLLSEETQQLRGVEVRGRRPIITRQADRLVFDAQQISAGAQNALDVLKRTPGLSVTDDGISIIGRGKAIILINDKRVRLSGEALTGLLRSYSQSDIAEVQVLTTPPAKYEAEGNAGVLNIVMKKAQNDYFGGSISADASLYKGRISPSLSTGLNYKQGRVSASLNLDGHLSSIVGTFDTYRTAPSTQLYSASTSLFDYKGRGVNIRGGLDYTINPELTVGFTATYAPSRKQTDRTNETRNYTIRPDGSHDLQLRLPGAASEKDHGAYTALNLHLEKTFTKAPGRKISWDADYVGSRVSTDGFFASTGYLATGAPAPGSDFAYQSNKGQHVDSYLTNVDFTLP
ncbi:MAG: carboxypeptidase, partial [Porphyromonadaceae bacterium]|nr:carboxypeptidase [Porphyromonadaceae bacterium]